MRFSLSSVVALRAAITNNPIRPAQSSKIDAYAASRPFASEASGGSGVSTGTRQLAVGAAIDMFDTGVSFGGRCAKDGATLDYIERSDVSTAEECAEKCLEINRNDAAYEGFSGMHHGGARCGCNYDDGKTPFPASYPPNSHDGWTNNGYLATPSGLPDSYVSADTSVSCYPLKSEYYVASPYPFQQGIASVSGSNGRFAYYQKGFAVAGDFMAIGSSFETSAGGKQNAGAIYMYKRGDSGTYTRTQRIVNPSYPELAYLFGQTLVMTDEYMMVSRPMWLGEGRHIPLPISAYKYQVLKRQGDDSWTHHQDLTIPHNGNPAETRPGNAGVTDTFSPNGEPLVPIGSFASEGVGLAISPSGMYAAGSTEGQAVYIWKRQSSGQLVLSAKITVDKTQPTYCNAIGYGSATIAITDDHLLLGCWAGYWGGAWEGDTSWQGGMAFFYHREGDKWTLSNAVRPQAPGSFGMSVSMVGDLAVIGAPHSTNEDGSVEQSGSVYIYARDANGIWNQQQILYLPDEFFQYVQTTTYWDGSPVKGHFGAMVGILEEGRAFAASLDWHGAVVYRLVNGNFEEVSTLRGQEGNDRLTYLASDGFTAAAVSYTGQDTTTQTRTVDIFRGSDPRTGSPTSGPTGAPTPMAPWAIGFLDILVDFSAASSQEVELNYEVGAGREVETFLYQKDCAESITDVVFTLDLARTNKNDTFDSLTLKYDIAKADIGSSSTYDPALKKLQFCQRVNLIVPPSNGREKMVISEDIRQIDVEFDLSVDYNITNDLGAGVTENATGSTDLASYVDACKCDSSSFDCNTDVLKPNEQLHVCVRSTDEDVEVGQLVSMLIAQGATTELEVVADGSAKAPSITSVDYDGAANGVRVSTFVPTNIFAFDAGESVAVSGSVELKLAGSGRRLRSLEGEGAVLAAGSEEAAYELQVGLGEDAVLGADEWVPAISSGRALAVGAAVFGMAVSCLSAFVMW